jgi:hypothetical protein
MDADWGLPPLLKLLKLLKFAVCSENFSNFSNFSSPSPPAFAISTVGQWDGIPARKASSGRG